MKKGIAFVLCIVLLMLVGCSANNGAAQTSSGSAQTSTVAETEAPLETDYEEEVFNQPKVGVKVAAIYTGEDKQPYSSQDNREEMLDTVWIYYDDNTFEQFAGYGDDVLLFSIGTYEFEGDSSFLYEEGDSDHAQITITRTKKYQAGATLSDYHSEHTYDLATLGFDKQFALEEGGRNVESIYYGINRQPYEDENGNEEMLNTLWVYYSDNTFEQFASLDNVIVLFSKGTYQLENGDFVYEQGETESAKLTINRTEKYLQGKGLMDYSSSHTYDINDLKSMGFVQISVIKD